MTRIICVGDIHVSDRPPINAVESYTDDILDMLSYIAGLEVSLKADAVVWAGDVFHHKQPARTSHELVQRMIEVVQKYQNLYIVTGNHDISNDRLESVMKKQPLGVLYRAGAKELDGWHETLPLFGVPWQQRWTTDPEAANDAFTGWRERVSHGCNVAQSGLANSLVVTHAPIFPPGEEPPYDYITSETIAEAMGHSGQVYFGHIHDYYGVWETDGVTFANVGAISRGSLTESNLTRPIKVALWEDGIFTEIDIPHKPASEVFKIEAAQASKETKLDLDDFLADVGTSTLEMSSTESVIDFITKADIPPRIKAILVEILESI